MASRSLCTFLREEFGPQLRELAELTRRDGDERSVTFYNIGSGGWEAGPFHEGADGAVRGTNAPVNTENTISLHTHPPDFSAEMSVRDYMNFVFEYLVGAPFGAARQPAVEGYGVLGFEDGKLRLTAVSPSRKWYEADPVDRGRTRAKLREIAPDRPNAFVPERVWVWMSDYTDRCTDTFTPESLPAASPATTDARPQSFAPGRGEHRAGGTNPLTRRSRAPDETEGKTVYRVGLPRITEPWIRSFTSNRDTGGLGTGVYAYVSRSAAEEDVERARRNDRGATEVYELTSAIDRPLVIIGDNEDRVRKFHKFSGLLSLIARRERDDPGYIDNFPDDYEDTLSINHRNFEWVNEPVDEGLFTREDPVTDTYSLVSFMTLRVGSRAFGDGLDDQPVYEAALAACREAAAQEGSSFNETWLQPINYFLWPQFDGVYPTSGAGGDSNRWGACILKQKIDRCLGRVVESNEDLDPQALADCFTSDIP